MDTEGEHAREVLVAQTASGERLLPNGTYRQVAAHWLRLPDGTTRAMTEAERSGAQRGAAAARGRPSRAAARARALRHQAPRKRRAIG